MPVMKDKDIMCENANYRVIIPLAENGTRCAYKSLLNKLLIRVDFPSPDSPINSTLQANCFTILP